MSPALPHTGGAYSFARSAMGPWGRFITGLAENMEYVITPAVVGAMGFLMHDIVAGLFDLNGAPFWNSPVTWWAVFYVVFVWINIVGIEATMRFTVVINILALGILAIPFAIWFYLAIEELPLAAEESHDPKRDVPPAPSRA
jgi:ethanolamine permease